MRPIDLTSHAKTLEAEISRASGAARISLQPRLESLLSDLESHGVRVPRRLKALNAELIDEVIEARFDNMPV